MRALACAALALIACACAAADAAPEAGPAEPTTVWVALHVATGQGQDEYFAQVSSVDLQSLRTGERHGFVLARRVCSIDDDGNLEEYADDDRGGDVWFRADDVRRVVPLKRDPHAGRDSDKDDADAKPQAEAPGPTLPKF